MEEMPSQNMPVQRLVSNLTAGLHLLWARKPFRGDSKYWQVSQEEGGRVIIIIIIRISVQTRMQ
jgi:hypothetical protein